MQEKEKIISVKNKVMSINTELIRERYFIFTKDTPLIFSSLSSLIVACGHMPNSDLKKILTEIKKEENIEITENTEITYEDFLVILSKCKSFKEGKDLLNHLLFFTNKQVVIKKDAFEKMINFEDDNNLLSRKELELLYEMLNVKDDKINLEEFVSCIVDD